MGENKVTIMVLEVDLGCEKCRKKVKKILCKIPQIQDQVWDENKNTVTIKVVCYNPEKIREKIICKGCSSIKCIKIVVPKKPEKPKETEKLKELEKEEPKTPKEPKKPKESCHKPPRPCHPCHKLPRPCQPCPAPPPCQPYPAPPPCQPCPAPPQPPCRPVCCSKCYKGVPGGPCFHCGGPPPCARNPIGVCCSNCYNGVPGGLCFGQDGGPPPLCYQYDGYIGRPVYDSYGGGRGFSGCGNYLIEENPQGCSVM